MAPLAGVRILLIAPKFFHYEEEIKSKLLQMGASVDLFDERPNNTFVAKATIRINKKFFLKRIREHYRSILEVTRTTNYDYVFFVNPESVTKEIILHFKNDNNNAIFILYMWDSLANKKNAKDIVKFFDKKYSFNKEDCSNSGLQMIYRSLFYLDAYSRIPKIELPKYDLIFIGSIHSDRYNLLKQIESICKASNITFFSYMFFPSKLLYYAKRITSKSLWTTNTGDFKFQALSKKEVLMLIRDSRVVIDFQHPDQIGLTMRTIEVLGARRKLITTNSHIVNYDFYNENNIRVIERKNIEIDTSFLNADMEQLDDVIFRKYSLEGWITDMFLR